MRPPAMSASAPRSQPWSRSTASTIYRRRSSASPGSTPSCRCSSSSTIIFRACSGSSTRWNSPSTFPRGCFMSIYRLPDLGEGLAEAEIVEWHVKVGDHVRVDQPMVSVETAKAVVEVPAPFSGIVTALRGAPGDIVPTGAPLIEFDSGTVVGNMPATSEEEFVESVTAGGGHSHGPAARGRAVPAARALAKRLGVDLAAVQGGGRAGLITLDDVLRHANLTGGAHGAAATNGAATDGPAPAVSPAARAIA